MQSVDTMRLKVGMCIMVILTLWLTPLISETQVDNGPFIDSECIACHTERNPELIKQWQSGPHAITHDVGCTSCHGDQHEDSNIRARSDHTCKGCHEGAVSHSYSTSKHGVINHLEEDEHGWQHPLQRGNNYRSPSCSYCHYHNGNHLDSMAPERGPEMRQWICSGCHSPRYVREQLANGARQLEIADLKVIEGERLIATAVDDQSDTLPALRQNLIRHRKNVLYGVGHQSPDYQWWHGQPALDGDLIRIRDSLLQSHQLRLISNTSQE
ncbi:MAG: multiheme c-type cytochrome [Candidatus Thiodiazotropha endolucinida]